MAEYKDVEFISPHIFMWKNSHWKLTGDNQRDSCTSKATRKVKAESSQKQRQAIRSGPMPLGGDSEEKDNYKEDLPWGVSSSSYILDTPVLGSD